MKLLFIAIFLFIGFIQITSCKKKEEAFIEVDKLVERDGKYYPKDSDIPFTGKAIKYSSDGKHKIVEGEIYQGLQHGKQIAWFVSGQTSSEQEWRAGVPDSIKEWDQSGNLIIFSPGRDWEMPIDFIFNIDWSFLNSSKNNDIEKYNF